MANAIKLPPTSSQHLREMEMPSGCVLSLWHFFWPFYVGHQILKEHGCPGTWFGWEWDDGCNGLLLTGSQPSAIIRPLSQPKPKCVILPFPFLCHSMPKKKQQSNLAQTLACAAAGCATQQKTEMGNWGPKKQGKGKDFGWIGVQIKVPFLAVRQAAFASG
jgi:hypothetical protein